MVRFLSEPLHESHYSESWFITLLTLSELRYGDYTSCQTRKFSGKVFNYLAQATVPSCGISTGFSCFSLADFLCPE